MVKLSVEVDMITDIGLTVLKWSVATEFLSIKTVCKQDRWFACIG